MGAHDWTPVNYHTLLRKNFLTPAQAWKQLLEKYKVKRDPKKRSPREIQIVTWVCKNCGEVIMTNKGWHPDGDVKKCQ